ETRQPPFGATPNRQAWRAAARAAAPRLARPRPAGGWLEPGGDSRPRGMAAGPAGLARPGPQNPAYRPAPLFRSNIAALRHGAGAAKIQEKGTSPAGRGHDAGSSQPERRHEQHQR